MATQIKISDLPSISAINISSDDVFPVVDSASLTTYKMSIGENSDYVRNLTGSLSASILYADVIVTDNVTTSDSGSIFVSSSLYSFGFFVSGSKIGTPEMYGAKGDGVTDDWFAFKHALISHSIVKLSDKTYAVRGEIGIPSNRSIIGEGKSATTVKLMADSPLGYLLSGSLNIFTNIVYQDNITWEGSDATITGTGSSILLEDTDVVDAAFNLTQNGEYRGLGTRPESNELRGLKGLRQNIRIKDLTIDCNFNNQAIHESYNYVGNSLSSSYGYLPYYSLNIRPTISAINLCGENITIENVKIKNVGVGIPFAATTSSFNFDNQDSLPYPTKATIISIIGGYSSASIDYVTTVKYPIGKPSGITKFEPNHCINCEIVDLAFADLMNPEGSICCFNVTNQSIYVDGSNSKSNYPTTDVGCTRCRVDLNENSVKYLPTKGSIYNNLYLDEIVSSSITQSFSPGGGYANFWSMLTSSLGNSIGSDGNYAILNSTGSLGRKYMKKIRGRWQPLKGNLTEITTIGANTPVLQNCLIKNVTYGIYSDSWCNNMRIIDNQFENFSNGIKFKFSNDLTGSFGSDFLNVIVKNNYFTMAPRKRTGVFPSGSNIYSIDLNGTTNTKNRGIDNFIFDGNIMYIPSSSYVGVQSNNYVNLNSINDNSYAGLEFGTNYWNNDSTKPVHKGLIIRNNSFIDFNSYLVDTIHTSSMNVPTKQPAIYFYVGMGSVESSSLNFKNNILSNYEISNNHFILHASSSEIRVDRNYDVAVLIGEQTGSMYKFTALSEQTKISSIYPSNNLLKIHGNLTSSGLIMPYSGSLIQRLTGSMFISSSKLWVYTGTGSAGGLVGWQTASIQS